MPCQPTVLLVEDNSGDVHLLREAFTEIGFSPHLEVAATGQAALAYLRRSPASTRVPRPALVLLDLNLPGLHGLEVLEILRQDAALQSTPVIVLSSSDDSRDLAAAQALHIADYLTKPSEFDGFIDIAIRIAGHFKRLHAWQQT